ncbi:MAG: autotransporter domain-containing protein [Chlamydiales bacterium]|nr:autotransporter domain-containing protein [Chlamydiales bacterium]
MKLLLFLVPALFQALDLFALDTVVVESGITRTTPIILAGVGDRAIVQEEARLEVDGAAALEMNNDDQKALNRGIIETTGNNATAILVSGERARILTSGVIETEGAESAGIAVAGEEYDIRTSGLIRTRGAVSDVIILAGDRGRIENRGKILAEDVSARGIEISGNDVLVVNSGTISSAAAALDFSGLNPRLELLSGSNLQGSVETVNPLGLTVDRGLNLSLTLGSGSFGDLAINAPFVLVGNTIAVIDTTGFAFQADLLADLSDTLLSSIYRHRFVCCTPCGSSFWVQGLGSYRERDEDIRYHNSQSGFLAGFDTPLCGGDASLFGGASFACAEVSNHSQKADIDNYVGGISYQARFCDSFFGFALIAGYVDWENRRCVMNNLAAGGMQNARAEIDGAFISPEVTYAYRLPFIWRRPVIGLTLRYAGLFLGDYQERGSSMNLSVKGRHVDLITTRLEFSLPLSFSCGYACWDFEPYLGTYGRYQVGGRDVDGVLLGEPLSFDQTGPRNLAAFLFGIRAIQSVGYLDLFINIEGSYDTHSGSRLLGEGGIGWNF